MRSIRLFFAVALGGMLAPSLYAANRFSIEDATLHFGSTGNDVRVVVDADQDLYSISIYLEYDPSLVRVTSVALGADAAATSPEWSDGTIDNVAGELTHGVVFDVSGPSVTKMLPAGTGLEVLTIRVDALAAAPSSSTVDLMNVDGSLPLRANVMTSESGQSIRPTLVDGTLTFADLSPVIQSFVTNAGRAGTVFFAVVDNADQSGLQVRVCGQTAAFVLAADGSTVQITAPACASGPAEVEVCTDYGCDSDPAGFTYLPNPPVIESFEGNSGQAGTTFRIVGTSFDASGLTVTVCGASVVPTVGGGGTTIDVTAPACAVGPAEVEVCTDFGCDSDPAGFTYVPGAPVIESFVGNSGQAGKSFRIVGRNFDASGLTATVCGTPVSPTVGGGGTTIDVVAPACAVGPAEVEVCTDFGCDSDPAGFTYVETPPPAPIIDSFAGNMGLPGDTFFVVGQNFGVGGLSVSVCGGIADATLLAGGDTIEVIAPPCATGPATVEVCTAGGCDSDVAGFLYEEPPPPPPVIESYLDNFGPPGTQFRIVGLEFDAPGLVVTVCGVVATAELETATTLLVTAPDCGPGPAEVEVCTDYGCDSDPDGFIYDEIVPPTPFVRGFINDDDRLDLSDGIFLLIYLFRSGGAPQCLKAADANDSGDLDVTDPVYIFNYLFQGGPPIPPPLECGLDPSDDDLSCESSTTSC